MNARRARKLFFRIGFSARLSARSSPANETAPAASVPRNMRELQPKFCPKAGRQSASEKKTRIASAPNPSKSASVPRGCGALSRKRKQKTKTISAIAVQSHIIARHDARSMMIPPMVGPKMTALLDMSI